MFSKAKQDQQERQMGCICFSGSELTITKRPCGEMSANELKIESFNLSQYPFLGYLWRKLMLPIESTMAKTRSAPATDMEELEIFLHMCYWEFALEDYVSDSGIYLCCRGISLP